VNPVILVDTNVLSYIFNQHSLGIPYKARLQGHILLLAAQTLEELYYGAFKAHWGANRLKSLANFLESFTIVQTTPEICIQCAKIRVECNQKGLVLDLPDAWIAATALALGIPLVTHNYKHFHFLEGLVLISENEPLELG
jgi:tRNA(fMet)-specific endonuclease VapC